MFKKWRCSSAKTLSSLSITGGICLAISLSPNVYGQFNYLPLDTMSNQTVQHTAFTLGYAEQYEQAAWVAYQLNTELINGNVSRTNNFREDPFVETGSASLADYRNSGFDRGHLAPAGSMKLSRITMSESFYLSNMSPQKPAFNRGIWKKLEEQVRDWALLYENLYVVSGPVLEEGLPHIGKNEVAIPRYYYKALLFYNEHEAKSLGFILENKNSTLPLSTFQVSIDSLELMTGIDFFHALPDSLELIAEAQVDSVFWNYSTIQRPPLSNKNEEQSQVCAGKTKTGRNCKNKTKAKHGFCHVHAP